VRCYGKAFLPTAFECRTCNRVFACAKDASSSRVTRNKVRVAILEAVGRDPMRYDEVNQIVTEQVGKSVSSTHYHLHRLKLEGRIEMFREQGSVYYRRRA